MLKFKMERLEDRIAPSSCCCMCGSGRSHKSHKSHKSGKSCRSHKSHKSHKSHRSGRCFGYRAMPFQGGFRNAEHVDFCRVRIRYETTVEPCRTTGDRRQRLGNPAASAGLRGSYPLAPFDELPGKALGQLFQFRHGFIVTRPDLLPHAPPVFRIASDFACIDCGNAPNQHTKPQHNAPKGQYKSLQCNIP